MPPSMPSLLECLRATGEDMVNGGLCMATEGTGGVHYQSLSSQIQWSREDFGAYSQEERHLTCWEAVHDSSPDIIGAF